MDEDWPEYGSNISGPIIAHVLGQQHIVDHLINVYRYPSFICPATVYNMYRKDHLAYMFNNHYYWNRYSFVR